MPTETVKIIYDVFISYARKDGITHAARLDADLSAKGFKTWRDLRDLNPTQDFSAEIETAIETSRYVTVCLTPDVKRKDSFVRREVQYALSKNKPIFVARMDENASPIVTLATHTLLEFHENWDINLAGLCSYLTQSTSEYHFSNEMSSRHPLRSYVEMIYAQANAYLKSAVIQLIDLEIIEAPNAVPQKPDMFALLFGDAQSEQTFLSFSEAFEAFNYRALLLGEPGAGKTVTLMVAARQAAADWLWDSVNPLPLLGVIATWNASMQPEISTWLGEQRGVVGDAVRAVVREDKALLLLDGLDELGEQRTEIRVDMATGKETEESYDPRQRFVAALNHQLGANKVLITCRITDYQAIGYQTHLDGAMTLKQLTNTQMQAYLTGDELAPLQTAIHDDENLRKMARTPLLLSHLAFAFHNRTEALLGLKDLREGALRDAIFNSYIDQRYKHEVARLKKQGKEPHFTLEFIREILGQLAMENTGGMLRRGALGDKSIENKHIDNVLTLKDFELVLSTEIIDAFVDFCMSTHVFVKRGQDISFIHLKLRDTLAFGYSLRHLRNKHLYTRLSEPSPAMALGTIHDGRAFEALCSLLQDKSEKARRRAIAADALGVFGDLRVVQVIVDVLSKELDIDIELRHECFRALRKFTKIIALLVKVYVQAIHDEDYDINWLGVHALKEIGVGKALAELEEWESDREWDEN